MLPRDELRKLFELRQCKSDTHDSIECTRCPKKAELPPGFAAENPSGALLALVCFVCVFALHPVLPSCACCTVDLDLSYRRWRPFQTTCAAPRRLQSAAHGRPAHNRNRHGPFLSPSLSLSLSFSFSSGDAAFASGCTDAACAVQTRRPARGSTSRAAPRRTTWQPGATTTARTRCPTRRCASPAPTRRRVLCSCSASVRLFDACACAPGVLRVRVQGGRQGGCG